MRDRVNPFLELIEKPTEAELNEIIAAIRNGDRIKAVSLYISSTGKGLTEAQQFIRTATAKLTQSTGQGL